MGSLGGSSVISATGTAGAESPAVCCPSVGGVNTKKSEKARKLSEGGKGVDITLLVLIVYALALYVSQMAAYGERSPSAEGAHAKSRKGGKCLGEGRKKGGLRYFLRYTAHYRDFKELVSRTYGLVMVRLPNLSSKASTSLGAMLSRSTTFLTRLRAREGMRELKKGHNTVLL